MALLNDVVTPSRVTAFNKNYKTTLREWPNGRTSAKRNWATALHDITVFYDGISLTEYQALLAHFDSNNGMFGVFTVTDTHTSTTYNVRFADDSFARTAISPNTIGRYNITLRLREVKT